MCCGKSFCCVVRTTLTLCVDVSYQVQRLNMATRARLLVENNYTMSGYLEAYRRFYSWIMTSTEVKSILQE